MIWRPSTPSTWFHTLPDTLDFELPLQGVKVVWRPSPSLAADILAHSCKLTAAQGLLERLRGGPAGSSSGAGAGAGGHAEGGSEGGAVTSIVSVRAQDLQQLKDQAR